MTDHHFMQHALELAKIAAQNNEVPVGAVLVLDNQIIASGANCPIATHDPSAHAEMQVLREAGKAIGNYRLLNATLYVTLEPCLMCVGAMVHARIKRVVYGASDPKTGAVQSAAQMLDLPFLNHRIDYTGGVLAAECGAMLSEFFAARR